MVGHAMVRVPSGKADATAYRRVHRALRVLQKGMHSLARWTLNKKPMKAKAGERAARAALEQLRVAIESTKAFASHPGISGMVKISANERFFSEKPYRPLSSYDEWLAIWWK